MDNKLKGINLANLNLLFIDVETTGLHSVKGDAICEIGALKLKGEKVIDTFQTLINPKIKISQVASKIHNIYQKDIENAPYFEDIAVKLSEFLAGSIICGYNIGFDLSFLNNEFKKINFSPVRASSLDVLVMARIAFPDLKKHNLVYVANFLNLGKGKKFHRAYDDAEVTKDVFLKIKNKEQQQKEVKLEELINSSQ